MSRRAVLRTKESIADAASPKYVQPDVGRVRQLTNALGIPLAYIYADSSVLAEVILAFSLLPGREQRRLAMELKARVSLPVAKPLPRHRAATAQRAR